MARPKKNNADYFSHDAGMRHDPRIIALRKKFKSDGYSVWCMMLETLTSSEGFKYEWSPLNIELIAGDFDLDSAIIKEIVNYMLLLELVTIEDGYIFSPKHISRFSGLMAKRDRDNQRYNQGQTEDETPIKEVSADGNTPKHKVSADGSTQSKVKETKDIINNRFDEFWDLYGKPVGKKKCVAKWNKLTQSNIEKIFIHVPGYVKSTPDLHFRKDPFTYLHNECWNDAIILQKGIDPVHGIKSQNVSEFDPDSLSAQRLAAVYSKTKATA